MLFQPQGETNRSSLSAWLPISLGLLASAIVGLIFCPVPRSEAVAGGVALFLAFAYIALSVAVGAVVLAVTQRMVGRTRPVTAVRHALPLFCTVAAWICPIIAFYRRDSLWAVTTAGLFAMFAARLAYRHNLAAYPPSISLTSGDPDTEARNRRGLWMKVAAILLQCSGLLMLASMARPAAVLVGTSVSMISVCYLVTTDFRPTRSRYQKPSHASMAVVFAMVFVTASLTPYLAVQGDEEGAGGTGLKSHSSIARSRRGESDAGFLQSVKAFFRTPPARHSRRGEHNAHGDKPFPAAPYPVLQALFGERKPGGDSQSGVTEKKQRNGTSTVLVTDSYPGMILRPLTQERAPIVPPVARRNIVDNKRSDRSVDPVSIPFYGAYWYYRASDGELPAGSIESRGDPTAMSFKTTDFTPIAMEARQSFVTSIDLSCCRSVELTISNGDRRPGTVSVELILANTQLPGKPQQSLGVCPVTSTQRWSADDDRPPVIETLRFRVPSNALIRSFDEATIRFQMESPRERWSAKIAILKFRLIPYGL